ncbi:MAG: HD domain-containing protein [Bacillota bacterium]
MWREDLLLFLRGFPHPAWGPAHSQRVYELSLHLAGQRGRPVDEDSLFAAAYLHDLGTFAPYRREGMDHAESSARAAEEILLGMGFPAEKIPTVAEIIRGHMFYARPVPREEAVVFHDADVLEFMGAIGVARILSIVGLDDWTPDLPSAVALVARFAEELPAKLLTPEAQEMGRARRAEMLAYLDSLRRDTRGLEVL